MNRFRAACKAATSARWIGVLVFACLLSGSAWGDMLNTTVTGTIQFGAGPIYSLGTATILDGPVEFTYSDSMNVDTIDFSNLTLVVKDVSTATWAGAGSAPVTYTFTDAAFAGLSFLPVSDSFGGATLTQVGDVLTLKTPGFSLPGTYQATFLDPPSVPEPSAILFLGLSAAALYFVRRKRLV
jgi:PEP-CTERM motif